MQVSERGFAIELHAPPNSLNLKIMKSVTDNCQGSHSSLFLGSLVKQRNLRSRRRRYHIHPSLLRLFVCVHILSYLRKVVSEGLCHCHCLIDNRKTSYFIQGLRFILRRKDFRYYQRGILLLFVTICVLQQNLQTN